MKMNTRLLALLALAACLALTGCAQRYVITQDLVAELPEQGLIRVGAIEDLLPTDMAVDDRPSAEDIGKFQKYLREEIEHRKHLGLLVYDGDKADYEIQGRLLDYEKGSGFMRFLFGFGAGASKVLTELKVVDLTDGSIIFSGNFEGQIADWGETGDKMFKNVARDFTKELEKQTGRKPEVSESPIL